MTEFSTTSLLEVSASQSSLSSAKSTIQRELSGVQVEVGGAGSSLGDQLVSDGGTGGAKTASTPQGSI